MGSLIKFVKRFRIFKRLMQARFNNIINSIHVKVGTVKLCKIVGCKHGQTE